jgi:hypothetical protein
VHEFEESSRWIAEMGEPAADTSDEDFVKGALAALDMLDKSANRMGRGWKKSRGG